jgi:TadE-like protein.
MGRKPAKAAALGHAGTTAVEFALVLPLLLMLLLGGLEMGRLIWFDSALGWAAEQAARCATIDPARCREERAIREAAEAALSALGVPVPPGTAALAFAPAPCGVLITLRLDYTPLVPAFAPLTPRLSASACALDQA